MRAMDTRDNGHDVSGIVLAGGLSSRMGTAKALLPFGGVPLITRIVDTLRPLCGELIVVASTDQDLPALPVKVVFDEVEHQGPVGGMYYGLKAARRYASFVTACDSAFLNPILIAYLVSQLAHYDAVVPYWNGRLQPLHAVYRTSVWPFFAEQLDRGERRTTTLFERVRTRTVEEREILRFDPEGASFFNMNTPEDYAAAVEQWERSRPDRAEAAGR
jgi:molybdenum cofactor guanylyltransferase